MTSLIKFLILSRSILIAFRFFFSASWSHWADPGSTACLTRVPTEQLGLWDLAATYWCSDLCGLFVALSRLDRPFVLSCGFEQKAIASWRSDSMKTCSPVKHRFSLQSLFLLSISNTSPMPDTPALPWNPLYQLGLQQKALALSCPLKKERGNTHARILILISFNSA